MDLLRSYRWSLIPLAVLLALPVLIVWETTDTFFYTAPFSAWSIATFAWHGMHFHAYLLEAAWWLAFVLLAAALVGRAAAVPALLLALAIQPYVLTPEPWVSGAMWLVCAVLALALHSWRSLGTLPRIAPLFLAFAIIAVFSNGAIHPASLGPVSPGLLHSN